MYLFKAIMMCQECGEIHAEKWLESRNRHVSQTVIEMLCDSCKENEFDIDPFAEDFDPMDAMEREHNGGDVCFLCTKPWNVCECFKEDSNCTCEEDADTTFFQNHGCCEYCLLVGGDE
jgi:hypothetical protein